ncbi:MAG TPA: RNA 2',3'-cyclic phosphodiesterase [Prolixibacteraceae bacterium]|nr:RNA 2',3'-cyclic phosphodiesterase [Prolixibacteraceae bacterium]
MKRLFIGIPIFSEQVIQFTNSCQKDELLNRYVIKWTNPFNWHITLIFLGQTPESKLDVLQKYMESSFTGIPSFNAELRGIGIFPNSNNPKVLWLGLDHLNPLISAQRNMVELLQQNGFNLENKPLKPHLTLARVKNSASRMAIVSLIDQYKSFDFGTVTFDRVILYESISTPSGPEYKPLFAKELSSSYCN